MISPSQESTLHKAILETHQAVMASPAIHNLSGVKATVANQPKFVDESSWF